MCKIPQNGLLKAANNTDHGKNRNPVGQLCYCLKQADRSYTNFLHENPCIITRLTFYLICSNFLEIREHIFRPIILRNKSLKIRRLEETYFINFLRTRIQKLNMKMPRLKRCLNVTILP